MDYGHPIRVFFSNIPNILADSADQPNKFLGILVHFWYYLLTFCHCASVVCDFSFVAHFFCKKQRFSYILQNFLLGIGIQFWAVENLESCVLSPCSPIFSFGREWIRHALNEGNHLSWLTTMHETCHKDWVLYAYELGCRPKISRENAARPIDG